MGIPTHIKSLDKLLDELLPDFTLIDQCFEKKYYEEDGEVCGILVSHGVKNFPEYWFHFCNPNDENFELKWNEDAARLVPDIYTGALKVSQKTVMAILKRIYEKKKPNAPKGMEFYDSA